MNGDESGQETKRGASRFQAGIPVLLHHAGEDRSCDARDLSRTGIFLAGDFRLKDRAPRSSAMTV